MQWDPKQYNIFKQQRREPFDQLVQLILPHRPPDMRVVDLGCGTGEWTRALHHTLGASETIGIDSSPEMLEKARAFAGDGVSFEQGNISDFSPEEPFDLIFSNAALQWVDNPKEVLSKLIDLLPGSGQGQLAVQVPWQDDYPSHAIVAELARREPYRSALSGWVRQTNALAPREYASLLDAHGMKNIHVRVQIFGHRLPGRDALLEWVEGSLLRSYAAKLPSDLMEQLRNDYRRELAKRFPEDTPIYYPFQRILFHAIKP